MATCDPAHQKKLGQPLAPLLPCRKAEGYEREVAIGRGFGIRWAPQARRRAVRYIYSVRGGGRDCNLFLRDKQL
jgi:hypothetical protein